MSEIQSIRFYHGDEEEEEQEVQCPECGAWIDRDVDECPECGANLYNVFTYRCPTCGAYLSSPYQDKCNHCGESVDPFEAINPIRLEEGSDVELKIVKHWKRGELSKREPEYVHYDIFFDDKQFVCDINPIINDGVFCSRRKPYKPNFIDDINSEINLFESNEKGGLGTGAWIKNLKDVSGKLYGFDDELLIKFRDGSDIKILKLDKLEDSNTWEFSIKDFLNCFQGVVEVELNGNASEMEMELQSIPVEVNLIEKLDDGNLKISGNIISEGAWNGVFFSKDVLKEVSEEEIKSAEIDVGKSHTDKNEDVGDIEKLEWREEDKAWWIECTISDRKSIELIESMDNVGFSIETRLLVDKERRIIEKVNTIDKIVVVPNPACQVCFLD